MKRVLLLLALPACTDALGPTHLSAPAPTDPCRRMACDDIAGTCVEVAAVDGTACDDGNGCTDDDHCVAGTCLGAAITCDDGNGCTSDSCDPAQGCVATDTTDACDDGDACTEHDTCSSGACLGDTVRCDDGDACTTDTCDPAQGCVATALGTSGTLCDGVGDVCAVGFVCKGDAYCESCAGDALYVPAGRFWMGCNDVSDARCTGDESPQHRVVVGAFAIQKTEVTAAAYERCVTAGGCTVPSDVGEYGTYGRADRADHPMTPVTWHQAADYCAWLDDRATGGADDWRLCSEAEWEKSARGGCEAHCDRADDDTCCKAAMPLFPWGDAAADCALAVMSSNGQSGCGAGITAPVGSRPESLSIYGVLDLAGNAREWVQDCWHADYDDAPIDGAARDGSACGVEGRVVRGGSAGDRDTELRASERYFIAPDLSYDFNGFRCCRGLD